MNVAAYLATKVGFALNRSVGKYGFNTLRRATGDALANQPLEATWAGSSLCFPALDAYWSEILSKGGYEPEVFAFLSCLRTEAFDFVDGGANVGYWSVLVSSDWFGNHRTVAIEASAQTYAWLERNRRGNANRFAAVHAALHRASGEFLAFDDRLEHAARHVVGAGSGTSLVVATTIDEVVARLLPGARTLVTKLDVEGAEPDALAGAARTLRECDCLFIIEDHGSDDQHRSARACLAEGLHLWLLGADGMAMPMPDLAAVARAKVRREAGYNFVACASESPLARRIGLTSQPGVAAGAPFGWSGRGHTS